MLSRLWQGLPIAREISLQEKGLRCNCSNAYKLNAIKPARKEVWDVIDVIYTNAINLNLISKQNKSYSKDIKTWYKLQGVSKKSWSRFLSNKRSRDTSFSQKKRHYPQLLKHPVCLFACFFLCHLFTVDNWAVELGWPRLDHKPVLGLDQEDREARLNLLRLWICRGGRQADGVVGGEEEGGSCCHRVGVVGSG